MNIPRRYEVTVLKDSDKERASLVALKLLPPMMLVRRQLKIYGVTADGEEELICEHPSYDSAWRLAHKVILSRLEQQAEELDDVQPVESTRGNPSDQLTVSVRSAK